MLKKALVVGTHSGCGKTTIMLALLQYLKLKQLDVQTFKAGPDYLDPFWHQAITGKPSYNLDTKMMGVEICKRQLNKQSKNAQMALIEGVMGLFDGHVGVGEAGSSAHLATVLEVPVILIVDVKGMAGSLIPLVSGFCDYADKLGFTIAGVIGNRVGSERHAGILRDLLKENELPPLFGWMEKNAPELPERHLGLKRPEETDVPDFLPFFHLDDSILSDAFISSTRQESVATKHTPLLTGKTIAVAKDPACCFIYSANINWLKEEGAEVRFFSPVGGEPLPENTDALWLPGGYPELYAEALSKSPSWTSIRKLIEAGKPVLAECGGAMLLGKELVDLEGKRWPMAGIFPYVSVMEKRLVSLGYRDEDSGIRGHEFHHSSRENDEGLEPCFNLNRGDKGVRYKNVRASYVHWYFSSAPEVMAGWLS
ncbi:MAG: cobyrinate a,c-diamide synthase [Methylococcaceae bacterium]|nr:cobyrinate a,c-diamide synthase [Methylococcaceae bacterium]